MSIQQLSELFKAFENDYSNVFELSCQLNVKLLKLNFSYEQLKNAISLSPQSNLQKEALSTASSNEESKSLEIIVPFKITPNKNLINGQSLTINNKQEKANSDNFLNSKRENDEKLIPVNYKEKFFDYKNNFQFKKEPKNKINNRALNQILSQPQLQADLQPQDQKKDIMDIFEEQNINSKSKVTDYISFTTSESIQSTQKEVGNKKSKVKNSSSFI